MIVKKSKTENKTPENDAQDVEKVIHLFFMGIFGDE